MKIRTVIDRDQWLEKSVKKKLLALAHFQGRRGTSYQRCCLRKFLRSPSHLLGAQDKIFYGESKGSGRLIGKDRKGAGAGWSELWKFWGGVQG